MAKTTTKTKQHSPEVANAIFDLEATCTPESLREAVSNMGPGCLFDDFESPEEVKGALKVLAWFQTFADEES